MTVRIAINGFGRIGRDTLRSVIGDPDLSVVAINDVMDVASMARLLKFDSTFGPLRASIDVHEDMIVVDGHKIAASAIKNPAELPWRDLGVDVVIESTGKFRTRDGAAGHLDAGARKVIVSAPGKGLDATIVMGVNDDGYDPRKHHVISNASCTTNCVAPMAKVLDEVFGIERGVMTTVHAYTNDQNVLDGPHKDPRRARAAAVNIIPTTTGAARAVGEVLPRLAGRLDGVALRVPVVNGSLVDLAVLLDREATAQEIVNAYNAAAACEPLAGRLRVSTDDMVSTDVIGDPSSCVIDAPLTQASGRLAKVFGWYDNEWGYTARLVDLARLVGTTLGDE